jgi:hypothetical protein
VVREDGNPSARQCLAQTMAVVDANWRGVGVIPRSGFALMPHFAGHDARVLFPSYADPSRRRCGEMPAGCDCSRVVLGRIYPNECKLYGLACTPRNPVGPCMVSDEGACRIWWAGGARDPLPAESATLSLLTLQSAQSIAAGLAYIALFGVGSIAGMATLSLLIAIPLRYSGTGPGWAFLGLQGLVGVSTPAVGSIMVYDIGIAGGLLL